MTCSYLTGKWFEGKVISDGISGRITYESHPVSSANQQEHIRAGGDTVWGPERDGCLVLKVCGSQTGSLV